MNRIPNLKNLSSNRYSGNNFNKNLNSNENKIFSNNYSNNIKSPLLNAKKVFEDSYNIKKDNEMHHYKGMDGRVYYTEEALDLANREYLENQNKGD